DCIVPVRRASLQIASGWTLPGSPAYPIWDRMIPFSSSTAIVAPLHPSGRSAGESEPALRAWDSPDQAHSVTRDSSWSSCIVPCTANIARMSPRVMTVSVTVKKSVSRHRIGNLRMIGVPEGEANAPHGLDEARLAGTIDLLAQVSDVDIDDIRLDIRPLAPNMIEDLRPAEDGPRVPGEVRQQVEFTSRQVDRPVATTDLARVEIDHQ